jgi:hypothetical protein
MLPERVRAGTTYSLNPKELSTLMEFVGLTPEKPNLETGQQPSEIKGSAAKKQSTYKGKQPEKPSKNAWTYKSDAQEQSVAKKSGFKGKISDVTPKKPRFNGKKSR